MVQENTTSKTQHAVPGRGGLAVLFTNIRSSVSLIRIQVYVQVIDALQYIGHHIDDQESAHSKKQESPHPPPDLCNIGGNRKSTATALARRVGICYNSASAPYHGHTQAHHPIKATAQHINTA